ncbi:hypothetical protein ACLK19_11925 [Escherichia coli]
MQADSERETGTSYRNLKASRDGRVADYAKEFWSGLSRRPTAVAVPVDIALPCATQNELDVDAAHQLIADRVKAVAEGQNCRPPSKRLNCSSRQASVCTG